MVRALLYFPSGHSFLAAMVTVPPRVIGTQIFGDFGLRTAGSTGGTCLPPPLCLSLLSMLPNIPPEAFGTQIFRGLGAMTALVASCCKRDVEPSLGSVCSLAISQRVWREVSFHQPVIDVWSLRSQRSTVVQEDHLYLYCLYSRRDKFS